ncbi:MAG: secreted hydrolase [Marmoricola sp.]|nr:secreted hydrolase [Marmoricola sp.]
MRRSVTALVLLLTAAFTVTAVPGPAGADAGLRYVNLGDSYSAGSGVTPINPAMPPECWQSTNNFAHVVARKVAATLTDVSCGGAQTSHFTKAQYPGLAPQLDAVKPDTQLVTMTIGGNDGGLFIGAVASCAAAGFAALGRGTPCADKYGAKYDTLIDTQTYPNVKHALELVIAKAPGARVAILGYPWIMPATKGCYTKMPVAPGDVPYLRSLQAHLNAVIARAAAETGATYVDLSTVSNGHDACALAATRWVEPVLGAKQVVPVHPNKLGEAGMAAQTEAVLGLS